MPQSQRGKKTKRQRKPDSHVESSLGIKFYKPSFAGMSRTEVMNRLRETGEEATKQFQQSFGDLGKRLLETDPIRLLSWLAFYGLSKFAHEESEPEPEKRIWQHEVELIQAVALQYDLDSSGEWDFRLAEGIHDLARVSQRSFEMRRLSTQDPNLTDQERSKLLTIEIMRGDTQIVRNWGHPDQMRRITTDLLRPLDDQIEQKLGVRTENLIKMCLAIISVSEQRARAHLGRLAAVHGSDSILSIAQNYCHTFPGVQDSPDDLIRFFNKHHNSLDEAKIMLTHHADLRLPELFTFTIDDFAAAYQDRVDTSRLQQALQKWSITFGELKDWDAEHFFLNNPVWRRPLIRLDDGTYFCPIIGLLHLSMPELMEGIIETDADISKGYEKRRGEFLEDSVEQLFKQSFPTAKVFRGSLWNDPETGKEFENDVLIIIDSHLIVVEAKGGKVIDAAQRGAWGSLKDVIEDLQVEASRQANRFAQFLQTTKGIHQFRTRRGVMNTVDNSNVHRTIRLNCILEDLGALSLPWSQLREAGLIPSNVGLVPTLSLADLEVVFHLLESSLEKLHYLQRRADFEAHVSYMGDEMDLLALYIETGFNVGEAEFNGSGFLLYGVDSTLRPYFLAQIRGQALEKPKRHFTDWWKSLLACIEDRKHSGWTHSGVLLHNADYGEQLLFVKELETRKKQVRRRKAREGNASFYLQIGPPQRNEALIGLVCKGTPREKRKLLIENLCKNALALETIDHGLVIALDIENDSYPYSAMAYFENRASDMGVQP